MKGACKFYLALLLLLLIAIGFIGYVLINFKHFLENNPEEENSTNSQEQSFPLEVTRLSVNESSERINELDSRTDEMESKRRNRTKRSFEDRFSTGFSSVTQEYENNDYDWGATFQLLDELLYDLLKRIYLQESLFNKEDSGYDSVVKKPGDNVVVPLLPSVTISSRDLTQEFTAVRQIPLNRLTAFFYEKSPVPLGKLVWYNALVYSVQYCPQSPREQLVCVLELLPVTTSLLSNQYASFIISEEAAETDPQSDTALVEREMFTDWQDIAVTPEVKASKLNNADITTLSSTSRNDLVNIHLVNQNIPLQDTVNYFKESNLQTTTALPTSTEPIALDLPQISESTIAETVIDNIVTTSSSISVSTMETLKVVEDSIEGNVNVTSSVRFLQTKTYHNEKTDMFLNSETLRATDRLLENSSQSPEQVVHESGEETLGSSFKDTQTHDLTTMDYIPETQEPISVNSDQQYFHSTLMSSSSDRLEGLLDVKYNTQELTPLTSTLSDSSVMTHSFVRITSEDVILQQQQTAKTNQEHFKNQFQKDKLHPYTKSSSFPTEAVEEFLTKNKNKNSSLTTMNVNELTITRKNQDKTLVSKSGDIPSSKSLTESMQENALNPYLNTGIDIESAEVNLQTIKTEDEDKSVATTSTQDASSLDIEQNKMNSILRFNTNLPDIHVFQEIWSNKNEESISNTVSSSDITRSSQHLSTEMLKDSVLEPWLPITEEGFQSTETEHMRDNETNKQGILENLSITSNESVEKVSFQNETENKVAKENDMELIVQKTGNTSIANINFEEEIEDTEGKTTLFGSILWSQGYLPAILLCSMTLLSASVCFAYVTIRCQRKAGNRVRIEERRNTYVNLMPDEFYA